jgi:hypothetical protein
VRDAWSNHPWVDALPGILLACACYLWVDLPGVTSHADRMQLYGAAGGIVAVVGGLGSIAVSA